MWCAQNTTHRVENHLQHGFWPQTCPNHVRHRLEKESELNHGMRERETLPTLAAVIFEI